MPIGASSGANEPMRLVWKIYTQKPIGHGKNSMGEVMSRRVEDGKGRNGDIRARSLWLPPAIKAYMTLRRYIVTDCCLVDKGLKLSSRESCLGLEL